MTVLLILAGAAFTTFMLYLMIKPLVMSREEAVRDEHLGDQMREIEQLMARRNVLVSALRELEFEKETNKIARDDYERFRTRYEREAVKIMKRLDEMHGGRGWEVRIEEELEERLGRKPRFSTKRDAEEADSADEPVSPPDDSDDDAIEHEAVEAEAESAEHGDDAAERESGADEVSAKEDSEADETSAKGDSEADETSAERRDDEPADEISPLDGGASDGESTDDEEPVAAELACAKCGTTLAAEDRFCSQCGTPVGSVKDDDPAQEASA